MIPLAAASGLAFPLGVAALAVLLVVVLIRGEDRAEARERRERDPRRKPD
jgi:hypothetical protein